MQCGAVVLTNLDEHSPDSYKHMESLVDIRQCVDVLPTDGEQLTRIGERARGVAKDIGWGPLVQLMTGREADIPDNVHSIRR